MCPTKKLKKKKKKSYDLSDLSNLSESVRPICEAVLGLPRPHRSASHGLTDRPHTASQIGLTKSCDLSESPICEAMREAV